MRGATQPVEVLNMAAELKRVGGFELLSEQARERLRKRVMDQDGNIEAVASEIRGKLDDHDGTQSSAHGDGHLSQAERAFYIAQLSYLNALAEAQTAGDQPKKGNFFSRFMGAFRGTRAAT
jgi:hypothetical protein